MNDIATDPSVNGVAPQSDPLADLERRVQALEAKMAAMPDQKHIETHITERLKANMHIQPPPPPVDPSKPPGLDDVTVPLPSVDTLVSTAKTTWTLLEMFYEFKALFWTLFDRRYHMAWLTRFIALALFIAIMTSDWWFPGAIYPNYISQLWDKLVNVLLCMILFMVLIFETRRYKEWRQGRVQ